MSRKTIEKEPDNVTYLDTYGWILHLLGKDKEAKSYFKHAMLYGGKESANILRHYATVLEALGETDLAKVYKTQAANKAAEGKE
jgi:Tfp pilus assembly protein PilF